MWSPAEIARAGQVHDVRLAGAVRHAEKYGVAEYLAAAPQLLAEWRDAWAPSANPRAAAMVLAAVDARRAGVHRPLPLQVLLSMHEPYLQGRGGERLRPEPADTALEWATAPLFATSSLLMPAEDAFLAFDYLIDAVSKERVPPQALDSLIAFSAPQEALDIGELAWRWSLIDQAESAFRQAEAGGCSAAQFAAATLSARTGADVRLRCGSLRMLLSGRLRFTGQTTRRRPKRTSWLPGRPATAETLIAQCVCWSSSPLVLGRCWEPAIGRLSG
jgi:hypothetical protein